MRGLVSTTCSSGSTCLRKVSMPSPSAAAASSNRRATRGTEEAKVSAATRAATVVSARASRAVGGSAARVVSRPTLKPPTAQTQQPRHACPTLLHAASPNVAAVSQKLTQARGRGRRLWPAARSAGAHCDAVEPPRHCTSGESAPARRALATPIDATASRARRRDERLPDAPFQRDAWRGPHSSGCRSQTGPDVRLTAVPPSLLRSHHAASAARG